MWRGGSDTAYVLNLQSPKPSPKSAAVCAFFGVLSCPDCGGSSKISLPFEPVYIRTDGLSIPRPRDALSARGHTEVVSEWCDPETYRALKHFNREPRSREVA